jgi:hypothetical protein
LEEYKSGEVKMTSQLNEAAEDLDSRASQTLKHSQKYVKISNKHSVEGGKTLAARMNKQLDVLDKWADRSFESAEAFALAIENGDAEREGSKSAIKDLGTCLELLWAAHKTITDSHESDYPSKTMKQTAAATRSKIKKAQTTLNKA